MASYQARRRDPLLDQKTQVLIEKRGKELIGLALLGAAVAAAMMFGSYVPEDPSWLSATDAPVQNLLGRFGAGIASPMQVIAGWGSWGLVLVLLAWGLRFVLHLGEERALGRLVFAPIGIALASVYASTHVPPAEWTHSFGLGGLFGDTVLGAVLGVLPVGPGTGLRVLALLSAVAAVWMGLFVLGFDRRELRAVGRFLMVGTVLLYARGLSLMGLIAGAAVRGAAAAGGRARARRAERAEARALLDDAVETWEDPAAKRGRTPLLSRIPVIGRRLSDPDPDWVPEPELVEPQARTWTADEPSEDRIRARIADAVRSRLRPDGTPEPVVRPEPPLRRAEPPVTAPRRARGWRSRR